MITSYARRSLGMGVEMPQTERLQQGAYRAPGLSGAVLREAIPSPDKYAVRMSRAIWRALARRGQVEPTIEGTVPKGAKSPLREVHSPLPGFGSA